MYNVGATTIRYYCVKLDTIDNNINTNNNNDNKNKIRIITALYFLFNIGSIIKNKLTKKI